MIEEVKMLVKELEKNLSKKPKEVNIQEDVMLYNLRTLLKPFNSSKLGI